MDFGGTFYKTPSVSLSLLTHKMGISPLSSGKTEVLALLYFLEEKTETRSVCTFLP